MDTYRISDELCEWSIDASGGLHCVNCGRHVPRQRVPPSRVLARCKAPRTLPRLTRWRCAIRSRLFWRTRPLREFWHALVRLRQAARLHGLAVYVRGARYRARWGACHACALREKNRCTACGCRLRGLLIAKLRFATEQCPHPEGPRWVSLITPRDSGD